MNLRLAFATLFSCGTLMSSFGQSPVLFSTGDFTMPTVSSWNQVASQLSPEGRWDDTQYLLLQWDQPLAASARQRLEALGVRFISYYPGVAYFVALPTQVNLQTLSAMGVRSVSAMPIQHKLDPAALNPIAPTNKSEYRVLAVQFDPAISIASMKARFKDQGITYQYHKLESPGLIFVQARPGEASRVAALAPVYHVYLQEVGDKLLNYASRATHGISFLASSSGRALRGAGITVGIGDDADISTHIDFSGRLINRSPWVPNDHGTHVSGTTAGAGIINVRNQGMAPKARLVNQFFSDILTNSPTYVQDYDMVLTNNSYFSVQVGCPGNGRYDILSNYIDNQLKDYPKLLHVIAAGNDGSLTCTPYPSSYGTIKSGWQSAKNVLTIGAMNTQDYSIAYFSSRGPLRDGRIKPEIVTGGWAVMSSNANNTYGINFGTSMASPAATGALALLNERYRQLHAGAKPNADLLKAVLCNSADDLGNVGPDFTFGFGMMNARKAVQTIEQQRYVVGAVSQGTQQTGTITIPAGVRRLKVMLYWADAPAAANASQALINDLDLTLLTPGGSTILPLVLNANPANVNQAATNGVDRLNNIEQVVIQNPTAGTYTWQADGFSVPQGPQSFVMTYEIEANGITLEYPVGDETLVPGETEVIRWTAFGNETETFRLEYSTDQGSSWTLIDAAVAANRRYFSWTIPNINTNLARVRVSRNNTSFVDQSDTNFVILGAPSLSSTKPCPGSIQMNWAAVSGATSYDVLQLKGDSMQVIANVTATNFLIHGLKTYETYWFGVQARSGNKAGRRSVSLGIKPDAGTCSVPAYGLIGDLRLDSILTPISGRQFFTSEQQALQAVQVRIANPSSSPVNPPISVSYRVQGVTVTEQINSVIPGASNYVHTFATPFTPPAGGFELQFESWVKSLSDQIAANDTATKRVRLLVNPPITSLPYTEGFESLPVIEARNAEIGVANFAPMDFSASSVRGRMRSFVNSGFARTGQRAITLDQAPYNANSTTDSLTFSYNLSNYTSSQLRYDFYYRNHGQQQAPGNKVWIRGSENSNWVEAYDLYANQAALSGWKQALINVNDVLASALPPQTVSNTFQLRIGQEGFTSANVSEAIVDVDDGYTIDDMVITEAFNDMALLQINSPDKAGCSLTSTTPISVRLKNYHSAPLSNVQVSYRINGGSVVTETIASFPANHTLDYTFTQTANMAAFTDYDVDVWVKFAGDNYAANDSILKYDVHNSPVVSQFPFLESFEQNDGFFYAKGTNSSWAWGVPNAPGINRAANGRRAWVTNLTGNYFDNETSYLYSPCFDVSTLTRPMLSFSHYTDIETDYDFSWVEYSTDGKVWLRLGATGSGVNWYDNPSANNWRSSKKRWHVASVELPKPLTGNLRFRFVMASDGGVTQEGIGIDDIHVFDLNTVYATLSSATQTQSVSGTGVTTFTQSGEWIGSIQAGGVNQGNMTMTVYPTGGTVRTNLNQYYLNRSFLVQAALPLQDTLVARLYFTDAEAEALIGATNCSNCNKPRDAYSMSITRFQGTVDQENGLLRDDLLGLFQLIPDSLIHIVPVNNGYYAEFPLTGLGEFWFGADLLRPGQAARCIGEAFTLESSTSGSTYQWQEDRGTGFADLQDGPTYSGVTTATLVLDNLPANATQYAYRCLVDGVPQNTIRLRFLSIWNGGTSDAWFTGSNWNCGNIPDPNTDVIIPGLVPHWPRVNGDVIIRSLRALGGSQVEVPVGINLLLNGF